MDRDTRAELERYDARARNQLDGLGDAAPSSGFGSSTMPHYLRAPYLHYEDQIAALVRPDHRVLELGAGTGLHTLSLASTGAVVIATDISSQSLTLLDRRILSVGQKVNTCLAHMEALPFEDNSFDVVACAGSLSYGVPELVDAEVIRVLRKGGLFLCVDSLNHNPIYRLNRLIHSCRGRRTKSTLKRMPDLERIAQISRHFGVSEVHFSGALVFAMPLMAWLVGAERAGSVSDLFDRIANVRRSAFKFVLIAKSLNKA